MCSCRLQFRWQMKKFPHAFHKCTINMTCELRVTRRRIAMSLVSIIMISWYFSLVCDISTDFLTFRLLNLNSFHLLMHIYHVVTISIPDVCPPRPTCARTSSKLICLIPQHQVMQMLFIKIDWMHGSHSMPSYQVWAIFKLHAHEIKFKSTSSWKLESHQYADHCHQRSVR